MTKDLTSVPRLLVWIDKVSVSNKLSYMAILYLHRIFYLCNFDIRQAVFAFVRHQMTNKPSQYGPIASKYNLLLFASANYIMTLFCRRYKIKFIGLCPKIFFCKFR